MIKVAHAISDANIGGAGKMLLTLLENYDRSRFAMEVLLPKGSLLAPPARDLHVPVREIEGLRNRSFDFKDVGTLLSAFREIGPDVVHTHAALSARAAAKVYGRCKIIATRHSVFDQPGYKKAFPLKQASGLVNGILSDVIIAVSPAAKANLIETGTDPKRIRVVFNGAAPQRELPEEERREVRRKYGLAEDHFVCAIIARLEEVKGHAYVLEAARELNARDPAVRILIAGGGSLEAELKEAARDLPNVIFCGFVSEIYEIENICDVQLNASWGTEATSLSLLEGMSLGIPAVVSDFGGNPYVIGDGVNGRVVPKKNAGAIAAAVRELKKDRELYERLSLGAKRIFGEKFTAGAMTRGIEEIYEEVCKGMRG